MQLKMLKEWTGEEVLYDKKFKSALIIVVHQKGENSYLKTNSRQDLIACLEDLANQDGRIIEIKYVIPLIWQTELERPFKRLQSKLKGEYYQGEVEVLMKGYPARLFVAHEESQKSSPSPERTKSLIKVLVVDDSPTIQKVMMKALDNTPPFHIEHIASSGEEAMEYLKSHTPDVMTLDINMPGMSGVDLLKKMKGKVPPTVLVTGLSMNEGPLVLEALECGAIDYIQKPEMIALAGFKSELIERLTVAAASKSNKSNNSSNIPPFNPNQDLSEFSSIVAIGASTGGTEAIKNLLKTLPPKFPPIVIVQHIPPVFSKAFADRLNQILPFKVSEARDGDKVVSGEVLIAPGGIHMRVVKRGPACYVALDDKTPERTGHRPSVDVLFESVADQFPKKAIGILLTGMGADGAQGLLKMKQSGSLTVNQDEETSVVYGMPKKAKLLGASEIELPLLKIGHYVSAEIAKRIK